MHEPLCMLICMYLARPVKCTHLTLHAYELNAINNVTGSTGIHTLHIIDICP